MRASPRLVCAWLLLCALGLAATRASAQDGSEESRDPASFTVSSPWPAVVNMGWWPAYADVSNDTREEIEGSIQVQSSGQGVEVDVPFVLGPGESARIEIELPAFHSNAHGARDTSYRFDLRVRGYDPLRTNESIQRDGVHRVRSVVVAAPWRIEGGIESSWTDRIKSKDLSAGAQRVRRLGSGGMVHLTPISPPASTPARPDVELAQVQYDELPSRVAAYTSLDLVIVPDTSVLPPEPARSALLTWVRCGGRLVLLGEQTITAARADPDLAAWLEPRFRVHGSSDAQAVHACGMGWIGVSTGSDPLDAKAGALAARLLNDFPLTAPGAGPDAGELLAPPRSAHWSPAIPGLDEVPMRAFIAVLFVFWLLIGPVNFYVVATRWKKPALLLVTIPALALLFSLLLFGYGIADQGLSTRQAVKSFSVLDQRAHRADSIDVRQLFIGFSAGGGLRPGANTVVFPTVAAPELEAHRYLVRAGGDPALAGAFTPVRTPTWLQLQSERTSRLRCDFEVEGGKARFRNGLDTAILELAVRDGDGRGYVSYDRIEAGEEAELTPVEDPISASGVLASRHQLGEIAFPAGSYLAEIERNPLLDDADLGAREVEGLHALLGILEQGVVSTEQSR